MPLEQWADRLAATLRDAWLAEAGRRESGPPDDGAIEDAGRMVVLGEPADTSALLVRLELQLLATRTPGGPVPYLVSLGSWPDWDRNATRYAPADETLGAERLAGYLQATLLRDHPELAVADGTDSVAGALLRAGLIRPLLDSLDDVPKPGRLLDRIRDFPGPGPVLAARPGDLPDEFDATLVTVTTAVVPADRQDDPAWLAVLDPDGRADLDPLALPPAWYGRLRLVAIALGGLAAAGVAVTFGGVVGASAAVVTILTLAIVWGMTTAPAARPMAADQWRAREFAEPAGEAVAASLLFAPAIGFVYFMPLLALDGDRLDEGGTFVAYGIVALSSVCFGLLYNAGESEVPYHRTPARRRRPATGVAGWRSAVLRAGIPAAVVFGALGYLARGPVGAVALGGGYGVLVGLQAGLLWTRWGPVAAAHAWLALCGRLPWRLGAALDDACRRGVLVQVGAVYRRSRPAEMSQSRAARSGSSA